MLTMPPVGRHSAVRIARPKKGLTRAGLLLEVARKPVRSRERKTAPHGKALRIEHEPDVLLSWKVFAMAAPGLPEWSSRLISELDAADQRAEGVARGLSPTQLNWQPRQDAWSVGQCLEHLRIGNEILVPRCCLGRTPPSASRRDISWLV